MKPRLLDLFCGAGGAAMGYARAGFEVVGVDIKPQPHYPFEFIQSDALDVLRYLTRTPDWSAVQVGWPELDEPFDVIHASPPCQAFTRAGHLRTAQGRTTAALDLVDVTRQLLIATGLPYIIENVPGAPLEGITLCGSSFGLRVRRHRIFESNRALMSLPCEHKAQGRPVGVYYRPNDDIPKGGSTSRDLADGQDAMGIDWMKWDELKESIPPSYTEWIGRQLITTLEKAA
jgi:DNA (cytosine-5)-methyltransferase 1